MRRTRVVPIHWTLGMLGAALASLIVVQPSPVWAQAGWYYLPEATLSETFDDNIFGVPSHRRWDFITRLSSSGKVGYRSLPLTFLATGAVDGEVFARTPDNDGINRTQSGIEAQWMPLSRLTLRLDGAFTKTQTPSELVSNLGVELGRQSSTDLTVVPSASYRLQHTTSLTASYNYRRTESGDVTTTTQEPRLRLSEQFTRVDLGSITYAFRLIESANSSVSSNLVMVGWARRLSRSASLILEAGPRLSDRGGVDAEANATISQRWAPSLETALIYTRTQITLPTQSAPSNTQSLVAQVTAVPLRSLTLALTASVSTVQQKDETVSEGVGVAAVYRITRWLSAVASYRFNHSETRGVSTDHSIVSIGLQARYPTRLDD